MKNARNIKIYEGLLLYAHTQLAIKTLLSGLRPSIHTNHVDCGNFIREWRDVQFNADFERQIFEKHIHGWFYFYLFSELCQKSVERKLRKKYIFFSYFG